ncbi:hypothetical protein F5X99DRAFT_404985 [Biscogniauxia marginata]|nr:hypothetical protein F5X99DRAFT_404985 [Biscogniauxia marginata]
MAINHISLATGPARAFYLRALAPLGYATYYDGPGSGGGGGAVLGLKPVGGPPDFWLHAGDAEEGAGEGERPGRTHVAFEVGEPAVVDRWYEGAIKAGGICNGKPGLRPQFSEPYYAAFVLDPLGNNIEAFHYATTRTW